MNRSNQHILAYLDKGLRYDGRKLLEMRNLTINRGVSKTAEGSAEVYLGKTHVMAGVKLSVGTPYSDTSDEGVLMINAELPPLASPDFETGPPSEQSIELARVVDRGLREGHAIDMKKLCIVAKEKVWMVALDIHIINDEGNLIDASAIAAMVALFDTKLPKLDEDYNVLYDEKTDENLSIINVPIPTTVYRIGNHNILDPTSVEEKFVDYRMTISSNTPKEMCAMQKGGSGEMTDEELFEIMDICLENSEKIRQQVKKA